MEQNNQVTSAAKIKQSSISGSFAKNKKQSDIKSNPIIAEGSFDKIQHAEEERKKYFGADDPVDPNCIRRFKNAIIHGMVVAGLHPVIYTTLLQTGGMQFLVGLQKMILNMCPFDNIRIIYNNGVCDYVTPKFVWRYRERINTADGYYFNDFYVIDSGVKIQGTENTFYIKFIVEVDREVTENGTFERIGDFFTLQNKDAFTEYYAYRILADIHPYAKRIRVK